MFTIIGFSIRMLLGLLFNKWNMDDHHNDVHEQNHPHEHENNSNNHGNMGNDLKEHFDGAMGTFKEMQHPGKFDLKKEFMNAIEILKLNEKKMEEVANNKSATVPALIFIAVGIIAMNLGMYFMWPGWLRPEMSYLLISVVYNLVGAIVGIFAIDFVANQFFKGKGNFGQLLRVMGYTYISMIPYILVAVVPTLTSIIGIVVGIWMLVVFFRMMGVIKKLSALNTLFTILIVGIALGIVMTIIARVFGLGYGFGLGSAGYGYGGYEPEIDSISDAMDALKNLGY